MQAAPGQGEMSVIQPGREKAIPSDPVWTGAFLLRNMTRRIIHAIREDQATGHPDAR
jgi:hypothetical protein